MDSLDLYCFRHLGAYIVFCCIFMGVFHVANKHTDDYTRNIVVLVFIVVNAVIYWAGLSDWCCSLRLQNGTIDGLVQHISDNEMSREDIAEPLKTYLKETESDAGTLYPLMRLHHNIMNLFAVKQEKRWAQEEQEAKEKAEQEAKENTEQNETPEAAIQGTGEVLNNP